MNRKKIIGLTALVLAGIILLKSCKTIPKGIAAVRPFDINKYLGKWYEIARFDYRFERDLKNTTAEYSLNDDGTVRVLNRGYNYKTRVWKEAIGKAKFVSSPDEAKLRVSFFGPFYAGYNVIAIDPEYKYAMIAGQNRNYLWLLSREKTLPEQIRNEYLQKARNIGYNVSDLIWVEQQ